MDLAAPVINEENCSNRLVSKGTAPFLMNKGSTFQGFGGGIIRQNC